MNGSTLRIIHMWRGYRDAEVAWIKILKNVESREIQTIGVLIYASRRGLLELWDTQSFERLAAGQASQSSIRK